MKKILFSVFLIFSFIIRAEAQILDCHNRVFSLEKIDSISASISHDNIYSENIELYLENGHNVLIKKVHSQDYRCLFNTIDGCSVSGYCKLHHNIYQDIRDGNFDEYVVYFKAYYRLGKINYYEFSLVSYKDLKWSMYIITDIKSFEEDKLIVTLENKTEQFDLSINTKFNPIDKPLKKGSRTAHVKYGILDYYKVLNCDEIEEIENFKQKKGIVL